MDNISLIGFMGSGKSSVGKELAKLLPSMELIDLDSYIEAMTGRTIPEIFENDGEAAFREMEKSALEDIFMTGDLSGGSYILSLGGGTVTTEACRKMIRRNTTCFYLKASIDTLVHNLETWPGDRPMLKGGKSLRSRIEELMASRGSIYEKTAHHVVDVDSDDYTSAAVDIISLLD
ncbi:MAG: shikimate kinase [Bacteroidales bacterium]|nr:shikimate kinase [Bacteroidales bacterium]